MIGVEFRPTVNSALPLPILPGRPPTPDHIVSYASPAAQYQEVAVRSASPGQLVLMVYDHLLLNLRRARMAVEQQNVEFRLTSLDRARQALGELLATLDHDRGGEVAGQLNALYSFLLAELTDLGMRPDLPRLDRLTGIVIDLRESFAAAAGASPAALELV